MLSRQQLAFWVRCQRQKSGLASSSLAAFSQMHRRPIVGLQRSVTKFAVVCRTIPVTARVTRSPRTAAILDILASAPPKMAKIFLSKLVCAAGLSINSRLIWNINGQAHAQSIDVFRRIRARRGHLGSSRRSPRGTPSWCTVHCVPSDRPTVRVDGRHTARAGAFGSGSLKGGANSGSSASYRMSRSTSCRDHAPSCRRFPSAKLPTASAPGWITPSRPASRFNDSALVSQRDAVERPQSLTFAIYRTSQTLEYRVPKSLDGCSMEGSKLHTSWTLPDPPTGHVVGVGYDEGVFFQEMGRRYMPLSADIRRVAYHFGEDASGDPAVWISIVVPQGLENSHERLTAIKNSTEKFKAEILKTGVKRWPYIKIETE